MGGHDPTLKCPGVSRSRGPQFACSGWYADLSMSRSCYEPSGLFPSLALVDPTLVGCEAGVFLLTIVTIASVSWPSVSW